MNSFMALFDGGKTGIFKVLCQSFLVELVYCCGDKERLSDFFG